jgi:hypothetical protein
MPQDEPPAAVIRADSIAVRVFIDASLSMLGFAGGQASRYAVALGALERAVSSQWPGASTSYYKFGDRVLQLSDAQREWALAWEPGFYADQTVNKRTRLELVFDSVGTADVFFLVTDLYQENADMNLVAREIIRRFLRHGSAVGVLGLRSAFHGVVYDQGAETGSFPYTGPRPFYIVAIGPRALIETAMDRLHQVLREGGALDEGASTTVILSPTLVEAVGSGPTADSAHGLNVQEELVQGGDSLHLLQFSFFSDTASLRIVAPWQKAHWSVDFEDGAVEPRVSTWFWDRSAPPERAETGSPGDRRTRSGDSVPGASPVGHGRWVPFTRARDWASATAVPSPGQLTVNVRMQRADLACGIHAVSVVVGPTPRNLRLPHWIDEWNLPAQAMNQQAGSKTLNLSAFLNELLYGGFTASEAPALANFRIYVNRACGVFGR